MIVVHVMQCLSVQLKFPDLDLLYLTGMPFFQISITLERGCCAQKLASGVMNHAVDTHMQRMCLLESPHTAERCMHWR